MQHISIIGPCPRLLNLPAPGCPERAGPSSFWGCCRRTEKCSWWTFGAKARRRCAPRLGPTWQTSHSGCMRRRWEARAVHTPAARMGGFPAECDGKGALLAFGLPLRTSRHFSRSQCQPWRMKCLSSFRQGTGSGRLPAGHATASCTCPSLNFQAKDARPPMCRPWSLTSLRMCWAGRWAAAWRWPWRRSTEHSWEG